LQIVSAIQDAHGVCARQALAHSLLTQKTLPKLRLGAKPIAKDFDRYTL
jgi:hypothetical protein